MKEQVFFIFKFLDQLNQLANRRRQIVQRAVTGNENSGIQKLRDQDI